MSKLWVTSRNLLLAAALTAFTACHRPDEVRKVPSPAPGLSLSVETYYGRGAVAPDQTLLYADFSHSGQSARELILVGSNLSIADLRWDGPSALIICLSGGYTGTFHNEVILNAGGQTTAVHSRLEQNCERR